MDVFLRKCNDHAFFEVSTNVLGERVIIHQKNSYQQKGESENACRRTYV